MKLFLFIFLSLFFSIQARGESIEPYFTNENSVNTTVTTHLDSIIVSSSYDLKTILSGKNKRYIITREIDLKDKTISVGSGSVIIFNGGGFSNGTLQMNGSTIESNRKCFSNIVLKGYDNTIYSKWYGTDLESLLSSTCNGVVELEPKTYYINKDVLIGANTLIKGNNATIISTANIYLSWRCRIEDVCIKNNKEKKACLVINSQKIKESISKCENLIDDIQVVAGIEIEHCSLYARVPNSADDHTQSNCVRVEALGSYYGWDYKIADCFMNGGSAAIEFYNSGKKDEIWMTNFLISRNTSTNNGCFIKIVSDSSAKKAAFSGINIEGNGVQWNYCTNYFVQLESVSCVTMTNNNFWDHGWNGAFRMSSYGCTHIEISDYMAISAEAGEFVSMYDIDGRNPMRISNKPSSYHLNATGSGNYLYSLPQPTRKDKKGDFYTLLDLYRLSDGAYYMSDKQTRSLLRGAPFLSSIGKYPRFMLTKVCVGNTVYVDVSPFTTFAGSNIMEKTTEHWFILRLCFVTNQGFKDIPVDYSKFVSLNGTFAAGGATYAMPGVVYYDTGKKKLVYIDDNNRSLGLKGVLTDIKTEGPISSCPSLEEDDKGFIYYCTDKNISIMWTGKEWLEPDGEIAGIKRNGSFSSRPTPRNVGFIYYNTDTHRSMTWGGDAWYYSDGTKATF